MREIPLSKGLVALVDDEDFESVAKYKWHAHADGYACRNVNLENGKRTLLLMHRFILGLADPDIFVDHKNLVRTDNRRDNLRACTRSENGANRMRLRNNTSGYKGVTWHKYSGRFVAKIRKDGKVIHLGYFDDPKEGSEAYKKAAAEIHGRFARHD